MIRNLVKRIPQQLLANKQKPLYYISVEQQGLNKTLQEEDPEIFNSIQEDITRQRESINFTSNENVPSNATIECVGTVMNAKYSEGYPGQRYYGGTEFIDELELLTQDRALEAFNLDKSKWGCNVQPVSGTMALFASLTGLLQPHDRIMSLRGTDGGHPDTGFKQGNKNVSALANYFEVVPYFTNKEQTIDYDRLQTWAQIYKPKAITVCLHSYSKDIKWDLIAEIAHEVGAYIITDISHRAGLYATGQLSSPFEFCDVIVTSTQGSLRGNRGGIIFYKVGEKSRKKDGKVINYKFKDLIDQALFPGLQGGPHNHSIMGIACALKEANSDYFKKYVEQSLQNTQVMISELKNRDYHIVSDGSDSNLFVIDLRNKLVNGFELENIIDRARIYANRTGLHLDTDYEAPTGIKLSSIYMTSRGAVESDFVEMVKLFDEGVNISKEIVEKYGYNYNRKQFQEYIQKEWQNYPQLLNLRQTVRDFGAQFPLDFQI